MFAVFPFKGSSDRLGASMKEAANAEIVFGRAIELPPGAARDALVASLSSGNDVLRAEVESLLQAHDQAGNFLRPHSEPDSDMLPRIPGYRLEQKLGDGGLGVVYAAHDEKLNRRVAIKVLRAKADPEVHRRILAEARSAAALGDPAIVTIYTVLDETDPPAIVMERVDGFAIDRFAAQLSFEQKARLLQEVARGLSVAHASGIIHRDLKPGNVIVGPEMQPRILDFGLAVSTDEAAPEGRTFQGTPAYASPEQVSGKALTPASDVFAFGSLMFKVLTGRNAFEGASVGQVLEAIQRAKPPFLRDVAVGIPEDLQAVCLACLSAEPGDRPSAADVAVELGRYMAGEPVRLKPKLYDDLLRRTISQYSTQAGDWESQSIISREERDSLEVVHRRLLADEDHWLIDARRITPLQTLLSAGTWLTVVATILVVWMLREDLPTQWRWILPAYFTGTLFAGGWIAHRQRETLVAATFLAGATLASAPCVLAILAELHLMSTPTPNVRQFLDGSFTNQQLLVSSLAALALSGLGLWRFKMTGFAWTTATLTTAAYLSLLMQLNWLDRKPEIQALWCLPLVSMEAVALVLERLGRVRWTLPFHLIALIALVAGLDVMALNGPTLGMMHLNAGMWAYFDDQRQMALSVALNGLVFLALMAATEKSRSLDLRRASRWMEVLAMLHILGALFANAMKHRDLPYARSDVILYVTAALFFATLAPLKSRWRMLVGGLAGCGLGSYLLVELKLVAKTPFIIGLGFTGLIVALATFAYVKRRATVPKPKK